MLPHIRYVVTKASDDGTFQIGDHIMQYENGDVHCREAGGWIDAEDVPDATQGMEYTVDERYLLLERSKPVNRISAVGVTLTFSPTAI